MQVLGGITTLARRIIMVSVITLNSPATPFRSIAVRGMWFYSMWFHIMTVCDSTLWRYVIPHYDSMWFHIMTVCDSTLWQCVIPHYDSMWAHFMRCISTLWRYVIPHYDSLCFRVMTGCDSILWRYVILHYDSKCFHIMTVCDSTLRRYVIPHYDSMWFHVMTMWFHNILLCKTFCYIVWIQRRDILNMISENYVQKYLRGKGEKRLSPAVKNQFVYIWTVLCVKLWTCFFVCLLTVNS